MRADAWLATIVVVGQTSTTGATSLHGAGRPLRRAPGDPPGPTAHGGRKTFNRALREFALVPALVVAAFIVLAAVSAAADQGTLGFLSSTRDALGTVVGKQASATALQAIATGLLTVTSITFSVLLLAVQQTASNLSPVVFDQFVRRRTNQLLLGFFVGLSLFAYVVMVAVQDGTPPIIGAAVATVLTVVGMILLLVLVYVTIDQMRPTNVMRQIHDRVLRARERQGALVQRTLRTPSSSAPAERVCTADRTGYVAWIDLDRLAPALDDAPLAEVRLRKSLGTQVAFGDTVATIHGVTGETADQVAAAVDEAVVVDKRRDLDRDPCTGVDEVVNIAWTSGSSSKHSPQVAREGVDVLQDLMARRAAGDEPAGDPLPVVFVDEYLDRLRAGLYSMLVVAHEAHQHMVTARALEAYEAVLPQADDELRQQLLDDLHTAGRLIDEMPPSPLLREARAGLEKTVAQLPT